jgi:hypothetical protein
MLGLAPFWERNRERERERRSSGTRLRRWLRRGRRLPVIEWFRTLIRTRTRIRTRITGLRRKPGRQRGLPPCRGTDERRLGSAITTLRIASVEAASNAVVPTATTTQTVRTMSKDGTSVPARPFRVLWMSSVSESGSGSGSRWRMVVNPESGMGCNSYTQTCPADVPGVSNPCTEANVGARCAPTATIP